MSICAFPLSGEISHVLECDRKNVYETADLRLAWERHPDSESFNQGKG